MHTLLEDSYRDDSSLVYNVWEYFRGMTAPTFFTITGFIFTFLLLKQNSRGFENPRVLKGIKRAVKVILWGYFLRLSVFALFEGSINDSFFYVDVLQCIGTSLLLLIGIYLIFCHNYRWFQNVVLTLGIGIFLLQPIYASCMLNFLPQTIANYFTSHNGSIFTLFPWFGYVCFGSFMSMLFLKYRNHALFYQYAIPWLLLAGLFLIFSSSNMLMLLYNSTGIEIFKSVAYNNFLFIRLGNVSMLFAIFMLLRNYLTAPTIIKIGGKTLSIYILHFFILYGSWLGLGLNRFFYHQLTALEVIIGALLFVVVICATVLWYYKYEEILKHHLFTYIEVMNKRFKIISKDTLIIVKNRIVKRYRNSRYARR